MKLLIDEQLSPQLAKWCAEQKGLYAVAAAHVGLSGWTDLQVWHYAFENDFVVVTANVRDFMDLLDVQLHPGLIVLREGNLARDEQWERLAAALDHVMKNSDPARFMINRVVEVIAPGKIQVHQVPPME